jgi:DNA-binding CsgD family transcriptional regulator
VDVAAEWAALFDEQSQRTGRAPALAAAARANGVVAAAHGAVDEAVACFERAAVGAALPFDRARGLLLLGNAHRRARRKRAARDAYVAAEAGFIALGAPLWVARVRHELAQIGGRAAAEGLTPSERRLVELVLEGRSNKEIAAALFVTAKTVETKLSRIYAKLGIHSRAQLASKL